MLRSKHILSSKNPRLRLLVLDTINHSCLALQAHQGQSYFLWFITYSFKHSTYETCIVRKLDCCQCENKSADQLRSNCEADQCLCFRYMDSTISLFLKSEISSFLPSSVCTQVGLCQTWSETSKTGFLGSRLIITSFTCLDWFDEGLVLVSNFSVMSGWSYHFVGVN